MTITRKIKMAMLVPLALGMVNRSSVQRRAKDLPSEQQKENEKQNGVAHDTVSCGYTEVNQHSEDQPDQHQNPKAECERHNLSPISTAELSFKTWLLALIGVIAVAAVFTAMAAITTAAVLLVLLRSL